MNKHWLYHISPCILASVICIIGIITGVAMGGWGIFAVFIFGPALAILLVADFLVKMLTKGRLLYIWIIEVIIVIIMILWQKHRMY